MIIVNTGSLIFKFDNLKPKACPLSGLLLKTHTPYKCRGFGEDKIGDYELIEVEYPQKIVADYSVKSS